VSPGDWDDEGELELADLGPDREEREEREDREEREGGGDEVNLQPEKRGV